MSTFQFGLLAVGLVIYLIPAWVAEARGKRNKTAIIMLNILLGWTFIGWVAALVWALIKDEPAPQS